MYYINGLRLEADEEYGYGVVKVEDGADTYYQVVDTRGKVIEGKKKIVKDKEGGYLLIIRNRLVAWCGDEDKPRWRKERKEPDFTIMIGGTRRITLPEDSLRLRAWSPTLTVCRRKSG